MKSTTNSSDKSRRVGVEITPEQIIASQKGASDAWLTDQWGRAHPIVSGALVGRNHTECALVILHSSVSATHIRLERSAEGWEIIDLGSLNGTFVGERPVTRSAVRDGDMLRIGDVTLQFSRYPEVQSELPQGAGRTVRSSAKVLPKRVSLQSGERMLAIVRRAEGGAIEFQEHTLRLARMEYDLLRVLTERLEQAEEREQEFVPSRDVLAAIKFRSSAADNENVRELVRRVRVKLKGIGITDLIESERGSGYRLCWTLMK